MLCLIGTTALFHKRLLTLVQTVFFLKTAQNVRMQQIVKQQHLVSLTKLLYAVDQIHQLTYLILRHGQSRVCVDKQGSPSELHF
jgi:hypothetical protein